MYNGFLCYKLDFYLDLPKKLKIGFLLTVGVLLGGVMFIFLLGEGRLAPIIIFGPSGFLWSCGIFA